MLPQLCRLGTEPGHSSSPGGRCRLLRFGSWSAAGMRPQGLAGGDGSVSIAIQALGPFGDRWLRGKERNAMQHATRQTRGIEKLYTGFAQHEGCVPLILVHFGDSPLRLRGGCWQASPASFIPSTFTEQFSAGAKRFIPCWGQVPSPVLLQGVLGGSTQQQVWGHQGPSRCPKG